MISAVDSANFLKQLESLHPNSAPGAVCKFPFQEASDVDMETAEVLIKIDNEEPSWWVWVTDDMVPSNVEERSGLDNDNYVIVNEEQVVDAVANFMARCVLANPKAQNMSPEQLQKCKFSFWCFF
nr:elongation factor [Ipomoea batatas]